MATRSTGHVVHLIATMTIILSLAAGCGRAEPAISPASPVPSTVTAAPVDTPAPAPLPPTVTPPPPTPIPTGTPAPPPASPTPMPPPPTPQPATHSVCAAGCTFTTIQAALDDPGTPDGAVIEIADPVHTEAGILVGKSVTIQGRGADSTIVQAYPEPVGATARVFYVVQGVSVTIRDLTIRHGYQPSSPYVGGGIRNDGALALIDCVVSHNAAADGGGIWNRGTLTVTQCTVSGNTSDGAGDPYVECGTGAAIVNADGGTLTVIDSAISDNQAVGKAGGIHVACYSVATLIGSTVTRNKAADNGGGIFVGQFGLLKLIDSTVQDNRTGGLGGGVYIRGTLEYTDTVIAGCVIGGEGGYKGQGVIRIQNNTRLEDNNCPWVLPK